MKAMSKPLIAAAVLAAVLLAPCAHAQETSTPTPVQSSTTARAAIEQAIREEHSHRAHAIAAMVVGGAIAITGAVVSGVAQGQNQADRDAGIPADRNTTTGTLVGALVGLPIAGIGLYNFLHAQHEINRLSRERASLTLGPVDGRPGLRLALEF